MKIIKNAMTTPIEITCPECKSVLEYTYKDIERREECSILGLYSNTKRYIVCPVCKRDIDIRAKVEVKEAENDYKNV